MTLMAVFLLCGIFPAAAQEGTGLPVFPPLDVLKNLPDYEQRMVLAEQIDAVRPVPVFVEGVLNSLAERLPERERQQFRSTVMAGMDMDQLEHISQLHLARLFTPEEMRTILEFYKAPSAESIIKKMPLYQQAFYPEVIRVINQSLTAAQLSSIAPAASGTARGEYQIPAQ